MVLPLAKEPEEPEFMETAHWNPLRDDAREALERVGEVCVLVGLPSLNDQGTAGRVVEVAGKGLHQFCRDKRSLIAVSDGGSTDDTREVTAAAKVPRGIEKLVTIYRGFPGKGSSLRAVFEMAESAKAKYVIVMDSDLRSVTPTWVARLLEPMLDDRLHLVLPYYMRHKNDATITRLIVSPLVRSMFGRKIKQPIGGEFGMTLEMARFYAEQDVWNTDVALFGIDIWLTVSAIEHKANMCQSRLGSKIHMEKDPSKLGPMFRQVVGTLFGLIQERPELWTEAAESTPVPIFGDPVPVRLKPIQVDIDELIQNFAVGFAHFGSLWKDILAQDTFAEVEGAFLRRTRLEFSAELWAKVCYDFLTAFRRWTRDKHKLVSVLTPLYYGRAAAYLAQVAPLSEIEAERVSEEQAEVFEKVKPYLVRRAVKTFE